ncbi:MAG TPA: 6,7-dimethyl-8-ribityllumazine synthase, partial [Gaiella sp.]
MSSRDIDSTSENVLHDWAREDGEREADEGSEPEADSVVSVDPVEPVEPEEDASAAWGAADAADADEAVATAVETEPEEGIAVEEIEAVPELDEGEIDEGEIDEGEIDETPMQVELSQEHAAGDLHIPDGYAVLEGVSEGGRRAVGVVVSRFNGSVTTQLLDGALAELATAGVRQEAITIMVVPGAFELPLAATALAKTRRFACIVALGCVIRGDTPHFDYVSSEAASGLQLAALETGVPVSFGLLTLD